MSYVQKGFNSKSLLSLLFSLFVFSICLLFKVHIINSLLLSVLPVIGLYGFQQSKKINLKIGREKSFKNYAFLSCFLFSSGQSLFFVLYPMLAIKLNSDISSIIEVFTTGSFLFIFTLPFWMSVSEKKGRVFVSRIGVFGLVLSLGLLYLSQAIASSDVHLSMNALWASRIVFGLFSSCVIPMGQAIFADSKDGLYIKNIAQFSQATALGRTVGPIIALVGMELSLSIVLILQILLSSSVLFYGLSIPKEKVSKTTCNSGLSGVINLKELYIIAPAVFLVAISITGVQSLQSSFMKEQVEEFKTIGSTLIALSFILANVAMLMSQHMISKMRDRSLYQLMMIASAFLVGSIFFLKVSHHWLQTMIAFVLFGVSSSGIRVSLMSHMCMQNEDKKATGIALINVLQTSGYAVGGFIMSYTTTISFSFSYHSLYASSLVLVCLVIISYFMAKYVNERSISAVT